MSTRVECPRCGSDDTVPIVYGMPASGLVRRAERHEVELGGCVVAPDAPDRACRECDHRWKREE